MKKQHISCTATDHGAQGRHRWKDDRKHFVCVEIHTYVAAPRSDSFATCPPNYFVSSHLVYFQFVLANERAYWPLQRLYKGCKRVAEPLATPVYNVTFGPVIISV